MPEVLNPRTLGRAMLERQLLLRRSDTSVAAAIEQVLGLNAQSPNLPYLALWNRIAGFAVEDFTAAIEDRAVLRSTMMRATQHVLTAADFYRFRPVLAPLLRRVQRNAFGRRTRGVDLDSLVADARELLADGRVLTRPELGRLLAERRSGTDPSALGWTVQYLEPVIHPAPSGTWDVYGPTPFARADGARRPATLADTRQLVWRYLAAFGPASVPDARAWSGVAGLQEMFDHLRPELRTFADESGRELFDLPDAPRPPTDAPAPVRFLPEFDAPLLAYADRTRVMSDDVRRQVCVGSGVDSTVLVDGTVAATWSLTRTDDDAVVLDVQLLKGLSDSDRLDIEAEAQGLLTFVHPDAPRHDVRVHEPASRSAKRP